MVTSLIVKDGYGVPVSTQPFLRSEVKELYGGADIIWYDPPVATAVRNMYTGRSVTLAFYGYEWAGVDKTSGKNVYYK